jgi:hypothetical protein
MSYGDNGVRVHANAISQPYALVVLWAQVPLGIATGCGCMLSGSVRSLRLFAHSWGDLCFSSGTCGWLTRLTLSVRWSGARGVGCYLGNAAG